MWYESISYWIGATIEKGDQSDDDKHEIVILSCNMSKDATKYDQ